MRCRRPRRRPRWWHRPSSRACVQPQVDARQCERSAATGSTAAGGDTRQGKVDASQRAARRGEGLRAHQKWSPLLYLQTPPMYFDALTRRGRPPAQPSSETDRECAASAGQARVECSRSAPSEHMGWAYRISSQPGRPGCGARAAGAGVATSASTGPHILVRGSGGRWGSQDWVSTSNMGKPRQRGGLASTSGSSFHHATPHSFMHVPISDTVAPTLHITYLLTRHGHAVTHSRSRTVRHRQQHAHVHTQHPLQITYRLDIVRARVPRVHKPRAPHTDTAAEDSYCNTR
jgi:hypothetical protein